MEMGSLTQEQADWIIKQAEEKAQEAEKAAADERRRQREARMMEGVEPEPAAEGGELPSETGAEPLGDEIVDSRADSAGESGPVPAAEDRLSPEPSASEQSPGEPPGDGQSEEGAT
jgi:N utilization substance protein A